MFIAGGVAALGGAILVMTSTGTVSILGAQEGYGWDGISVSLIANLNPLANLFTGVLFSRASLQRDADAVQDRCSN